MTDLEKKLNGLPKARLSRLADLRIRYRLFQHSLYSALPGKAAVSWPKISLFKQAFAAVMIVIFIVSGTSVYAYSNDRVTRGNVLYPLKRGVERIELSLAVNPRSKVVVLNKLARRRLIEAQLIGQVIASSAQATSLGSSSDQAVAMGEPLSAEDESLDKNLNETINEAAEQMAEADDQSEQLGDTEKEQAVLERLADADEDHVVRLEELAGTVGIDARETVVDRVAVTLDQARRRQKSVLRRLDTGRGQTPGAHLPASSVRASTVPAIANERVDAENSLGRMKDKIDLMRGDLTRKNAPPKALDRLIENLNAKIKNTEKAINDGDFKQAGKLLEKTEALTNNSDHFLKLQTEKPPFEPARFVAPKQEKIEPADKEKIEAEKKLFEEKKKEEAEGSEGRYDVQPREPRPEKPLEDR
jgi:hypothetical protein